MCCVVESHDSLCLLGSLSELLHYVRLGMGAQCGVSGEISLIDMVILSLVGKRKTGGKPAVSGRDRDHSPFLKSSDM